MIMNTKGFTLIEILVSLAVFGLIMVAIAQFQVDILRYNKSSQDSLQSAQYAQSLLRTMVKELRPAKPADDGSYTIAQAGTSSLAFFSDIDADGHQEKVRYFMDVGTLKKAVIKPSGPPWMYDVSQEKFYTLAQNVVLASSTPLFEYFDASYTGTTSPLTQPVTTTDIKLIKINLFINADPNRTPTPRMYSSQVMLRNLKDTL